jgi:hypothetical protein
MRRTILLITALLLLLAAFGSSPVLAQGPNPQGGPPVNIPFHPVNPNYYRIKAGIDAQAPAAAGQLQPALSLGTNWEGQRSTIYSPSDSNGAIGPSRYIELVNDSIGVYDRTGSLLSQNSLATWTNDANASSDPVVMYSAPDQRFYATMLHLSLSGLGGCSDCELIFGFSKTSTPSASNSDWCFYKSTFGGRYGSRLPDYPKLGDSANFILMGVNTFGGTFLQNYLGSDVAWVSKPAKGTITTCPSLTSFKLGVLQNLKNTDGTQAATPNPAKQADALAQGVVIATKDPGSGTSTFLTAWFVTKSSTGTALLSAPKKFTVSGYAYPPSAVQPGTTFKLDTLDARLMSAWVARDPSKSNQFVLWTGHTVKSVAGLAEFRWYEIAQTGILRKGTVNSSGTYVFMGAISPDRNGAAGQFGSNAVMVFNTSSSTLKPTAATADVVSGVQSGITAVHISPASDTDFTCKSTTPCRWGDYSGSSPDPAATGSGKVWGTAMVVSNSGNPSWTTWNWVVTP